MGDGFEERILVIDGIEFEHERQASGDVETIVYDDGRDVWFRLPGRQPGIMVRTVVELQRRAFDRGTAFGRHQLSRELRSLLGAADAPE